MHGKDSEATSALLLSLQALGWGPPTSHPGIMAQQFRMDPNLFLVVVNNKKISRYVKGLFLGVWVVSRIRVSRRSVKSLQLEGELHLKGEGKGARTSRAWYRLQT